MKRVLAFVLGGLSLVACVYAGGGTLLLAHDYMRDGGPIWQLFVTAVPAAMCLAAGWLGSRLVQFGVTGNFALMGMFGDVFVGLCCFFPGFIFSFIPIAILAARLRSGNGDRALIVALCLSAGIGVVCSVLGVRHFVKKHRAGVRNPPPPANSLPGPETNLTSQN
jgi:hypothetical protein